jgi:hypothetical protein
MEGEAVPKNERKAGGGGGGGVSNDGGASANARRRWKGGGGRHHPIIQAYPALLPLPLHARRNGIIALPLPHAVTAALLPLPHGKALSFDYFPSWLLLHRSHGVCFYMLNATPC